MKFDKLSKPAQQRAIDWFRDGTFDHDWYDSIFDDAVTCLWFLGFEVRVERCHSHLNRRIWFESLHCQGEGCAFEADFDASKVNVAKMKEHANDPALVRLAVRLSVVALQFPDMTARIEQVGRDTHKGSMEINENWSSGEGQDVDEDGPTQEQDAAMDEILDCAREASDWILRQLRDESEYISSDEYCIDGIKANDYNFDSEGRIK